MAKTAAELQAELDAIRAREEEARREEERRRQAGWFDQIGSMFSSLNFGSIFMALLVMTGIYFAARTPWGQKILDGISNILPESWRLPFAGLLDMGGIEVDVTKIFEKMPLADIQKTLAERGKANAETVDIIAGTQEKWDKFFKVVKEANNGRVTISSFTNADTIVGLITKEPEMAQRLVVAMMKPGADGKSSGMGDKVTKTLKEIVNSPHLDTLLSETHRANTIKILATVLPQDLPMSENGLSTIITKGLDAKGKPTDALRKLFTDVIERADKKIIMADLAVIVPAQELPSIVDRTKLGSQAAQYAMGMVTTNANATAAYNALTQALGAAQTGPLMEAMGNTKALTDLLLNKQNAHALPQAAALLNQLPDLGKYLAPNEAALLAQAKQYLAPDRLPHVQAIAQNGINPITLASNFVVPGQTKFSPERAIDMIVQPVVRGNLQTAGIDHVAALVGKDNPFVTTRNLTAMINFGAGIGDNAKNMDGTVPNALTRNVMHAIIRTGTPGGSFTQAFKGMKGDQIAAFFSVPGNLAAFNRLLDPTTGLDRRTLTAEQNREFDMLRAALNPGQQQVAQGVGLGAILTDAKSVQFLLNNMGKKPSGTGIAFVDETVARTLMGTNGGDSLDIKANQDILLSLGKVLNAPAGTAGPASSLPVRTGSGPTIIGH